MKPDAGSSLVEVLIALAIMGLATTAIVGALATQVAGTTAHRDQSNAAVVASSAAELVKAASYAATCNHAGTISAYQSAARGATLPTDWIAKGRTVTDSVSIVAVRYWTGSAFDAAGCGDNRADDPAHLLRMQEIEVRAVGPEGDSEIITVVKTDPVT